jgi:hypothetical protein
MSERSKRVAKCTQKRAEQLMVEASVRAAANAPCGAKADRAKSANIMQTYKCLLKHVAALSAWWVSSGTPVSQPLQFGLMTPSIDLMMAQRWVQRHRIQASPRQRTIKNKEVVVGLHLVLTPSNALGSKLMICIRA